MIDGFNKIEIVASSKPTLKGKSGIKRSNFMKTSGKALALVFAVIIIFSLAVFIPAKDIYSSVQKTARVAKETAGFLKNQDLANAETKLKELRTNLDGLKNSIDRLSYLGFIPFIGGYEKDAQHMVTAAIAGVEAGQITVDTLLPYSDLLGLKGKSSFTAGSADDRIKMAVETLDKMTPKLSEISDKIVLAGRELAQIDPGRYPERFGSLVIKGNLVSAKNIFADTAQLFVEAQPLLRKLPQIMGTDSPKTYLVLFQNDKELRATGGFITAYALFKVDKGKMQVVQAEDIYKLDAAKVKKLPAPDPILKYHQNVFTFELRDSNLSPDYIASMKTFESKLADLVPGFPKFDGIITLDTHVLVSAIRILGDFNIYGRTFSAENDKRCDCPKAIYELEDYSTRPVGYVRGERKDIIGVLLYQIMQRSLGVSPSKYWGKLFQMFLDEAKQKHMLFYFHDGDAQKGIEAVNFAGRIANTDSDYLHVSNVNFAGAKSNLFVRWSIKQEINTQSDGVIQETLTIDYKNPSPPSNCNLEAGQLCLNGILRNWLRVYVPKGSTLLQFNGSEKDTVTYDDLGKTVFEGFLTVKPQGASQVKIVYKLPMKKPADGNYNLLVQKQPGTDKDDYSLYINGRQVSKLPLIADQKFSAKM